MDTVDLMGTRSSVSQPGGVRRPRFIHVGPDTVFFARFAEEFELITPGDSDYVVLSNQPDGETRHLFPPSTVAASSTFHGLRILRRLRRPDVNIVAHYVDRLSASALMWGTSGGLRVWSGFGADYYPRPGSDKDATLGPLTAALKRKSLRKSRRVGDAKDSFLHIFQAAAARRATHFSAPVPTDLAVFREAFPKFSGRYLQLNYATTAEMVPNAISAADGDVLIGNSASLTSNHLDVFATLSPEMIGSRRVVVPLSYGDPGYRDVVIEAGRARYGQNFTPLIEQIPLAQYNEILAGCAHIVMGHRRQQGVGNIITALLAGSNLVMDEHSPVTTFLTSMGAHIHTLAQVGSVPLDRMALTSEQRADNARVAQQMWGADKVRENIRELVAAAAFADRSVARREGN